MAKVFSLFPSEMTLFADQVRIRLTSKLVTGISKAFQKLFKYFNGTAISTFIVPTSLVLVKNLDLNLNDSESVTILFGPFLQNWYKLQYAFQ